MTFIGLPLAISRPGSDDLVADPAGVKQATASYFSNLYARDPEPQLEKPWLNTPSVVEIRRRKGNPRPMPNGDGMEKWCVRHLPDKALTVMTALHNYEVMYSRFPEPVDKRLSMIHKRGLRTDLDNWRGISIAALLWNSPAAWLNHLLMPYVTRMGILPQTQIASHKGVQAQDLTSFLAGMKGFDRLAPQGFYDAIAAYGLPISIIALDKAAQAHNRCVVRTAYGFTDTFIVDGVTPQGASLSPFKSGLTTSMGNRYLADLARGNPGTLTLRMLAAKKHEIHTPDDKLELSVTMVEATDDSFIFALTLQTLLLYVLAMERFQFAYGWLTQWKKTILSKGTPEAK
ncbi:hypothetical protein AURDEDRAFT_162176 [Auricularia subglabra TFB-10046 SS5]|nr:hypothetical protein AURDEDRAFT_162176 [Auricularia subglabra TFB-10046 SS5]